MNNSAGNQKDTGLSRKVRGLPSVQQFFLEICRGDFLKITLIIQRSGTGGHFPNISCVISDAFAVPAALKKKRKN